MAVYLERLVGKSIPTSWWLYVKILALTGRTEATTRLRHVCKHARAGRRICELRRHYGAQM
jgi:hypothetical protein